MRRMIAFSTSSRCARAERRVGSALLRLCVESTSTGRSAARGRSARPRKSPMIVDERDHHFARRSSSAWAKYADAFRRISFARFSSTTSRSRSFICWRSSVVSPRADQRHARPAGPSVAASRSCIPASRPWTDRGPLRRVLGACSRTIRTARSRTSGEYRLVVPWAPSSHRMGPPTIPVRFKLVRLLAIPSSHFSPAASDDPASLYTTASIAAACIELAGIGFFTEEWARQSVIWIWLSRQSRKRTNLAHLLHLWFFLTVPR